LRKPYSAGQLLTTLNEVLQARWSGRDSSGGRHVVPVLCGRSHQSSRAQVENSRRHADHSCHWWWSGHPARHRGP